MDHGLLISVIVCTRNRADSLRTTLEHLAAADREGIAAEVVVVDNGSQDDTREVSLSFSRRIAVRCLYEPTQGVYGKSHALNRALNQGRLGSIIAVLDDDMTVRADWFRAVAAICRRWPNVDLFTGDTPVVWPDAPIPAWAHKPAIRRGAFSSIEWGEQDRPLCDAQWFPGGHFWFRSRVLASGQRFRDIWLTEPDFQLNLLENGCSGVASSEAVAGHRIQPELLDRRVVLQRARQAAQIAWVRLRPFRRSVPQALRFHAHPVLARVLCLFNCLRWGAVCGLSFLLPSRGRGFEWRVVALERMGIAWEYLRAARGMPEYSCWKVQSAARTPAPDIPVSGSRTA